MQNFQAQFLSPADDFHIGITKRQLAVTAPNNDQCGRFRSNVWSPTVLTSEICGFRIFDTWKITANHGKRHNSRQTPKFTVAANTANSWFSFVPTH